MAVGPPRPPCAVPSPRSPPARPPKRLRSTLCSTRPSHTLCVLGVVTPGHRAGQPGGAQRPASLTRCAPPCPAQPGRPGCRPAQPPHPPALCPAPGPAPPPPQPRPGQRHTWGKAVGPSGSCGRWGLHSGGAGAWGDAEGVVTAGERCQVAWGGGEAPTHRAGGRKGPAERVRGRRRAEGPPRPWKLWLRVKRLPCGSNLGRGAPLSQGAGGP